MYKLQVAFVPDSKAQVTRNISVVDVPYHLYARSHHHYGLNDAFDTSLALLLGHKPSNP